MANVNIVAAQNTNFITAGGGSLNRLTVLGSALTNGDRYLALYKGLVGVENGCTELHLGIGGVPQTKTLGIMCAAPSNGQLKQISGMALFTADGVSNITVRVTHRSGLARTGDEQLVLINLDNALVETTDWLHSENANTDSTGGGTSFGNETEPSSLTFIPDGISNYLVIGHLRFTTGGSSQGEAFRVQDITNGVTIAQMGPGHANTSVEEHVMVVMGVLPSPTEAITLETQYKSSPALTKSNAQLFVLRLNAFAARAQIFSDFPIAPTGSRQSQGNSSFLPDAAGEVLLLSSFTAEATPGAGNGHGIIGDVEFGGSIVSDINDSGRFISPSDNVFGKTDSIIGPNFYRFLTGQVGLKAVEGFVQSSTPTVDVTLVRRVLIALGTEVVALAPPQVPVRAPLPGAVEQPRSTNIFFHIGGPDGVDLTTLDVQLQIGGGGFFQAVQAGVSVFPFDGPQALVSAQGDGFDVTVDNRGVWPVDTQVDVRINADSVSGIPMNQVDYLFTSSSEAVPSGVLVQITRD